MTRKRDPYKKITEIVEYARKLEDLIDEAAENGVFMTISEIGCCSHGYHLVPDVEIYTLDPEDYDREYVSMNGES